MMSARMTSAIECCLIKTVEAMISTDRIQDPIKMGRLDESFRSVQMAACTATVLRTWMLGKIFVGVSDA